MTKSKKGLSGVKLNPFDKVRKRPAAYIGTVKNLETEEWVFDEDSQTILKKLITYNTGILHLFTEIMSNAIDNMWRSKEQGYKMTKIEVTVDYDPSSDNFGWITILNDGYPIPVELRKYSLTNYRTGETTTEKAYPADYFWGEFDSGTNYEEDANRKSSGLHGIGGKIVTALSEQAIIEHTDPNNGKKYYKLYEQGGKVQNDPVITSYSNKNGYTSVSFLPDFDYFKVDEGITEDFFGLLKRRVYEAAMITGLNVSLNGEKVVVKNLEKFTRFFYPDPKENKSVHFVAPNGDECVLMAGGIPEVNQQPQPNQVSWVNGINTANGGIHVNAWVTLIIGRLVKAFNAKKRPKDTPQITATARMMFPWLIMYVRAESFGAIFESNSKDQFTGVSTKDDDGEDIIVEKIVLDNPKSKEFMANVNQSVEKIMKWDFIQIIEEQLIAQAEGALLKDPSAKNKKKFLEGKFIDANKIEEEPEKCTLFICEGTSAKTMAERLISFLPGGHDYWGVFELRGKFVNLCKDRLGKALSNKEFQTLKMLSGLVPFMDYSSKKSRKTLRYGNLQLLTDSDRDGFHIRGLVTSSLNKFWPTLISQNPEKSFISDFSTYVIIVSVKEKFHKGYNSLQDFEADEEPLPKGAIVRYLKGIGAHKPNDTAGYADNIQIRRYFKDSKSDKKMHIAFEASPDHRKKWILDLLQQIEDGEPIPLSTPSGDVSISEFIDRDIAPYFLETLSRALPSIWDDLKDSQRKCLFGMVNIKFPKSGEKSMMTVTGEIKEKSGYHKGELYETVARMTHSFAGSNNINFFIPGGECGTRKEGGGNIAKERYLATGPEKILKDLFPSMDFPLLERVVSEDRKTKHEYTFFTPVVPLVLINGAEGISTGWATKIPCYNPKDVIEKTRKWIKGKPLGNRLVPWFRGFRGENYLAVRKLVKRSTKVVRWEDGDEGIPTCWVSKGNLYQRDKRWSEKIADKGWVIDEIPIGVSIESALRSLNFFYTGIRQMKKPAKDGVSKAKSKAKGQVTAKVKPRLRDINNYSLPNYPEFHILPTKDFIPDIDTKGNMDFLIKVHSFNNMVLLNAKGIPTKYESAEAILEEWCELRLGIYTKRKKHWIKAWGRDKIRQQQKHAFISYVLDGSLDMHQKDDELESSMLELGLLKLVPESKIKAEEEINDDIILDGDEDEVGEGNFEYLLSMQMRSMTEKKLKDLEKEIEKIQEKIDDYRQADERELWERDLDAFEEAYEKHIKILESRDQHDAMMAKKAAKKKSKTGKKK